MKAIIKIMVILSVFLGTYTLKQFSFSVDKVYGEEDADTKIEKALQAQLNAAIKKTPVVKEAKRLADQKKAMEKMTEELVLPLLKKEFQTLKSGRTAGRSLKWLAKTNEKGVVPRALDLAKEVEQRLGHLLAETEKQHDRAERALEAELAAEDKLEREKAKLRKVLAVSKKGFARYTELRKLATELGTMKGHSIKLAETELRNLNWRASKKKPIAANAIEEAERRLKEAKKLDVTSEILSLLKDDKEIAMFTKHVALALEATGATDLDFDESVDRFYALAEKAPSPAVAAELPKVETIEKGPCHKKISVLEKTISELKAAMEKKAEEKPRATKAKKKPKKKAKKKKGEARDAEEKQYLEDLADFVEGGNMFQKIWDKIYKKYGKRFLDLAEKRGGDELITRMLTRMVDAEIRKNIDKKWFSFQHRYAKSELESALMGYVFNQRLSIINSHDRLVVDLDAALTKLDTLEKGTDEYKKLKRRVTRMEIAQATSFQILNHLTTRFAQPYLEKKEKLAAANKARITQIQAGMMNPQMMNQLPPQMLEALVLRELAARGINPQQQGPQNQFRFNVGGNRAGGLNLAMLFGNQNRGLGINANFGPQQNSSFPGFPGIQQNNFADPRGQIYGRQPNGQFGRNQRPQQIPLMGTSRWFQ